MTTRRRRPLEPPPARAPRVGRCGGRRRRPAAGRAGRAPPCRRRAAAGRRPALAASAARAARRRAARLPGAGSPARPPRSPRSVRLAPLPPLNARGDVVLVDARGGGLHVEAGLLQDRERPPCWRSRAPSLSHGLASSPFAYQVYGLVGLRRPLGRTAGIRRRRAPPRRSRRGRRIGAPPGTRASGPARPARRARSEPAPLRARAPAADAASLRRPSPATRRSSPSRGRRRLGLGRPSRQHAPAVGDRSCPRRLRLGVGSSRDRGSAPRLVGSGSATCSAVVDLALVRNLLARPRRASPFVLGPLVGAASTSAWCAGRPQ